MRVPAGSVRSSADEAFYVVSGTFTVFVNGRLHALPAGSFVFIPRGTRIGDVFAQFDIEVLGPSPLP